jgi:hypothetical protein
MCEDAPCCGCCGQQAQEPELMTADAREMEQAGWPGDGSGEDDLADHNANEADDYRDEGNEDAGMENFFESQTDLGDMGD